MAGKKTTSQIQQSVEDLLKKAGVDEIPIPVEKIARFCGAQLKYVPFEGDLSGLLFQEEDQIIIGVNALHPKTRQRFTIAHELGHLTLHSHDALHVDRHFRVLRRDGRSSQAIDPTEIEANAFAAELLMPTAKLKQELKGYVVDYEDDEFLRTLADRYKVSLQAMIFRLTNLGLLEPLTEIAPQRA